MQKNSILNSATEFSVEDYSFFTFLNIAIEACLIVTTQRFKNFYLKQELILAKQCSHKLQYILNDLT